MNEEMRSSAEELETSKEELQSVNEELIDGQSRAEGERRGVEPDQRRPQQPDGLDRYRDSFFRSATAHPSLHAERAEDF